MNAEEKLIKVLEAKPFGIKVSQTWIQIGLVFQLIEDLHIGTFIELGLFCGGLADLLIRRAETVGDITYHGFERDPGPLAARVRTHPSAHIADVFLPATVAAVLGIIEGTPAPALVYCDDGDKPREMRTYATVLRPGDHLMAHDYPGETTPESLAKFAVDCPWMVEVEPDMYHRMGVSLWRRVG